MTAGRTNKHSSSHHWGTSAKYVDATKKVLGVIYLDPCSNVYSIVGARLEYVLPMDGLVEPWDAPTIYVNPPYGKDYERGTSIKDWLRRCAEAGSRGSEVMALIPVATNTSHWKEFVWPYSSGVCFLFDTRLKFLERGLPSGKGAPMACAMVYWGSDLPKFKHVFDAFGRVVQLD